MSLELQTKHENMDTYIIIIHVEELFDALKGMGPLRNCSVAR